MILLQTKQTNRKHDRNCLLYRKQNVYHYIAEIAKAMLFMGNPYGFNRAKEFPSSSVAQMREVMELNGFQIIA